LAGETGLSIFAGKPTGNVMVKYLTQHMVYGFVSCTSDFSYQCSRNKHLAHMCGGIKTLKHNIWTTLRLAYHGCKNLTPTSKARQVKRTRKWLQLVDSRLLLFQSAKNRTQVATKRSRESMWDLNQNRCQKVVIIGGFTFGHGDLTFWKLDKISTDYSVSYFNLEWMLPVATGVF